jgi:hypothetical protein
LADLTCGFRRLCDSCKPSQTHLKRKAISGDRLTWFYAKALRAHLLRLATRAGFGALLRTSDIVRFVYGRCRKNLPCGRDDV